LTIARTITAGEIANNRLITVNSAATTATVSAASLDLTLAATSTLWSFLKNDGDEYTFDFVNQSPTAATTTQIVAGTGCTLVKGVADGDDTIPGQKGATIVIKRVMDWLADGGSKDCVVWVYEWN
jgi:Zn-dependent alcohol dehydrogenase